jgi:thiol-disulfide isomerase/thioredoxin
VLLTAGCQEPVPPLHVAEGQLFPQLSPVDLQGEAVSLKKFAGKAMVVNIWATWCAPCRHELPSLQRLEDLLDNKKYAVIGISVDGDNHLVREYLIERKIRFKNFLDLNMTIANKTLGIRVYPSTFLVRSDGKLAAVVEGWRDWDSPELVAQIENLYLD